MFSGDGLLTIIVYDEKRCGGYFKVGIHGGGQVQVVIDRDNSKHLQYFNNG